MGGSGETAAQRASRIALLGGRAGRTRNSCRNTAAREFLRRARGTIRFVEHSPVNALALSQIVAPEDVASPNLTQDVVTRWGSTYLALCRLYTMWPRLSVFVPVYDTDGRPAEARFAQSRLGRAPEADFRALSRF